VSDRGPGRRLLTAAAVTLAAVLLGLSWLLGHGAAGPFYLLLFAVWLVPGLPVGWCLFGIRHPAGWMAGAILGYPITALAFWAPLVAGWASVPVFVLSWCVVTAAIWRALWPSRHGRVSLDAWTRGDMAAWLLLLLLVPALVGLPFARIGSPDADGTQRYRAYFTADFLWHMALTAELEKFEYPPRNPYLAAEPLHYYWLYFVPPSTVGATLGAPDREGRLALNALGTGLLLLTGIYLFARLAGGRAAAAGWAVALAVVASSAEGLYAAIDRLSRGQPLSVIRDLNIDAITLWDFGAFTIDGPLRAMLYNPQHSLAAAAGLVALAVATASGATLSVTAATLSGIALGFSLMLSPFPGGVLTLIFGLALVADLLATPRQALGRLWPAMLAIVPVGAALAWIVTNGVLEGAGGDLRFGLHRRAMAAPLAALALAIGPLLVPVLVGLGANWRMPRAIRPAAIAVVTALALIFFVSLQSADVWIGWRAGQILLVTAPALAAHGFAVLTAGRRRIAGLVLGFALFGAGLPTTLFDVFNAQDVENDHQGPGFRWVVTVSRQERQALAWIESQTPRTAIVQMEPTIRGRDTWTLIPSFAERRMSAGLPISLLDAAVYHERSQQVRDLYAAGDPVVAWQMARALGIDYLYLGTPELSAFPQAETAFLQRPDLFQLAFGNPETRIYRVRPTPASSSSAPASPG